MACRNQTQEQQTHTHTKNKIFEHKAIFEFCQTPKSETLFNFLQKTLITIVLAYIAQEYQPLNKLGQLAYICN